MVNRVFQCQKKIVEFKEGQEGASIIGLIDEVGRTLLFISGYLNGLEEYTRSLEKRIETLEGKKEQSTIPE
jgi:hypothetical protein